MDEWQKAVEDKLAESRKELESNAIDIRACEFSLANLKEKKLEIECSIEMNENRLKFEGE